MELHVCVCMHMYKLFFNLYAFVFVCALICYLQQLKGSQQFPGSAVPSVNLVVLQLRREPRGAVVLVTHLDGGLRKRPTYEFCLALNTTL